jgi:hypothetical protein
MAQIARGYLKLHLKKAFFKILNIFLFYFILYAYVNLFILLLFVFW